MYSAYELFYLGLQIICVEIVFVSFILSLDIVVEGSINPLDVLNVIMISVICSIIAVIFLFIGALIIVIWPYLSCS